MLYGHQIKLEIIMVTLMGQGPVEAKYGPVGWNGFRPITPYNSSIPLGFHKQVKSRCALMSSSRATG